jgi:hypothetical protein
VIVRGRAQVSVRSQRDDSRSPPFPLMLARFGWPLDDSTPPGQNQMVFGLGRSNSTLHIAVGAVAIQGQIACTRTRLN